MRIDIMSIMRGVDPFPQLWERRTRFVAPEGETYDLLSLPDLVRSKKTQRDKDWPMIRRLIEADYVGRENASETDIRFWLRESRTPAMLVELARRFRRDAEGLAAERPLLKLAIEGTETGIVAALEQEEGREREADVEYWVPLRRELEDLRHAGLPAEEVV